MYLHTRRFVSFPSLNSKSAKPKISVKSKLSIAATVIGTNHCSPKEGLRLISQSVDSFKKVARKATTTRKVSEKADEKIVLYLPKPILESSVAMNKRKESRYPSKIPTKSSGEPPRKVAKIATPILLSKTALSKMADFGRPSKIPVRSFRIEADLRKPYQPPKPMWLSKIALLQKQSSKLASKIPIMKLRVVEKKYAQCLYTPVSKSPIAMSKKDNSKLPSRIPVRRLSPASFQRETKVTDKMQNTKEKVLSKVSGSKRLSKIPVRSFRIEADLRKPYLPPKPMWLSRIALLQKQSSKLASKIPIMKLRVVEKKCGQCLYTPVSKSPIAMSKKGNSKLPSRIPIRRLSPASLQKETKVTDKIQNLKEKEMSVTASERHLRYELYIVLNMAV